MFTKWLKEKNNKKDLAGFLSSYIDEKWWPKEAKNLNDYIIATRKNVPSIIVELCYKQFIAEQKENNV